ncbi:MAG: uracil-DNA glycosylase [Flavobacterium sp.]|nr:uracil-DNA glycosylase [Flavobacterium sp.]
MLNHLSSSWYELLSSEFEKAYFEDLIVNIENEYKNETCFPPQELIFKAFNKCTFQDLKVVIIGQDPYHGKGEANGLCFSVPDDVKIPPSLRNIFREISSDLNAILEPSSGNLTFWANQGVLLLNSTLTVRENQAASHQKLGWEIFTDAIIKKISDDKKNIVFLLWGNYAIKKGKKIDTEKHLVLQSGHPSPLSANQGKWFGNSHFSKTNLYLKSVNKKQIEWF